MSGTWRNLKQVKVDGTAFKRERLRFKNQDNTVNRGEYGYGSQEWLAEQARISPRAISSLERGKASVKTVDAVSKVLGIQGREYIWGYGADFTTFRTAGVIDFRSSINGRLPENETTYQDAPFLLTLLPIAITVDDDFISTATLQKLRLKLSVRGMEIDFIWIYNVLLTSRSNTWLGDEKDVSEVVIPVRETYQSSVMFRQDSLNSISWRQFINHIGETDDARILLTLTLEFERFEKEGYILISTEEIKGLFKWAYPHGYPYWIEPNALMP